jgi:hypothetical protein
MGGITHHGLWEVMPDITPAMLDYTEVHVVLQPNPDGRRVAETNRKVYRRKNLNPGPPSPSSSGGTAGGSSCSNSLEDELGVDLNRSFPFRWGFFGFGFVVRCLRTHLSWDGTRQ